MACHMRTPLALLVGGFACHGAAGQEPVQQLEPMVVVASRPVSTLEVTLDPKKPGSPMPAADGAGYLKNVTGMSMVRKGGWAAIPCCGGWACPASTCRWMAACWPVAVAAGWTRPPPMCFPNPLTGSGC